MKQHTYLYTSLFLLVCFLAGGAGAVPAAYTDSSPSNTADSAISRGAQQIADNASYLVETLNTEIIGPIGDIAQSVNDQITELKTAVSDVVNDVQEQVQGVVGEVQSQVQGVVDEVQSQAQGVVDEVQSQAQEVVDDVGDSLSEAASDVGDSLSDTATDIGDAEVPGLGFSISDAAETVKGAYGKIVGIFATTDEKITLSDIDLSTPEAVRAALYIDPDVLYTTPEITAIRTNLTVFINEISKQALVDSTAIMNATAKMSAATNEAADVAGQNANIREDIDSMGQADLSMVMLTNLLLSMDISALLSQGGMIYQDMNMVKTTGEAIGDTISNATGVSLW